MKKPISFTTHHEQDHRENYWLSRTPEERLAELVRLRKKAFAGFYSRSEINIRNSKISYFKIREGESLEELFARANLDSGDS